MSLPDPKLSVLGFDVSFVPKLSTDEDPHAPDLGPGMGQVRDAALDADAQRPIPAPPPPTGPTASEEQAAQDLDASIERARGEEGIPPLPLVDPIEAIRRGP